MSEFVVPILKSGKSVKANEGLYIEIPPIALQYIRRRDRKAFRVQGSIDKVHIRRVRVIPKGGGVYVMPINKQLHRSIGKGIGDEVKVFVWADNSKVKPDKELALSFSQVPHTWVAFMNLSESQKEYFNDWVMASKTPEIKSDRIAATINALLNKQNFATMKQELKRRQLL